MHGGATPIKHGLYSKYTYHRLADVVDRLANDEELLDLRKTIALQQALILDILERLEGGSLELDTKLANTLSGIADQLGRNIERRQKIEEGEKYILKVEEVQQQVKQITVIIREEVSDADAITRIGHRLKGVRW